MESIEPVYIGFPNGRTLTFSNICQKLDLKNSSISFSQPEMKTLVNFVCIEINNTEIIKIVFHSQKDGIHVICMPGFNTNIHLQLVMRNKIKLNEFMRKLTAAVASVISYQYLSTFSPLEVPQAKIWVKSTYRRFFNQSLKVQGLVYQGCGQIFLDMIMQCKKQIEEVSGLSIASSLDRLKKEFFFLNNHLTEDEVIKLWRESTIAQVHET